MTNVGLPNNVYSLRQNEFTAIPGNPWVYWIIESVRKIFNTTSTFNNIANIKLGLSAVDVFRFNKYVWEVQKNSKWKPLMKGGGFLRWYGNNTILTNWYENGTEVKEEVIYRYPYLKGNYKFKIRDEQWLCKRGLTYTNLGGSSFSARLMPEGSLFDDTGPAIFSNTSDDLFILGLLNSSFANYLLLLINPSIHFQKGDLEKLPLPLIQTEKEIVVDKVKNCIYLVLMNESTGEYKNNFVLPMHLCIKLDSLKTFSSKLDHLEAEINREFFRLYKINSDDLLTIENELTGSSKIVESENEDQKVENIEETMPQAGLTIQDLGKEWLSYNVGIILNRFHPGTPGALGSAIYRRSDFAIGSLPEPTEEEFNELVGDPSQFAYIDEQGGRHVFSREVEKALQKLAIPDGIAVFDPNHPRDLPTLVSKALELMLGQAQAQEVIQQAAGGDLRKYLEKDFFTQHHIKQYRKRPVYWPIQSSKRSYGFVLFHEKIDRNTFYALQQEPYLPTKRRAVQLRLEELGKKVLTAQGAARKPIEKEMDELRQLAEELAQFAKDLDAITRGGYEPEADWIDDGVILRMAPLWSVIPLWKSEPKKYWEELAAGKYDWSHIAMHYWPERVKQACKKNKSYAIAHGHEEWYQGN